VTFSQYHIGMILENKCCTPFFSRGKIPPKKGYLDELAMDGVEPELVSVRGEK